MKKIAVLMAVYIALLSAVFNAAADEKLVFNRGEAPEFAPDAPLLEMYVVPMIGGDCTIVRSGGQNMLIDMGKANEYGMISTVLDRLGITRIDIAFNTHPHDDHIGTMIEIAEHYEIGTFITAFDEDYDDDYCLQIGTIAALKEMGIPIVRVEDGDIFEFGDATCSVYQITDYPDTNLMSAVLMMVYGERRVLMTGDLIDTAQFDMADGRYDLRAEIVGHPHHGLKPMYNAFIRQVQPEYSIITNNYSQSAEARDRLNMYGIKSGIGGWGTLHLWTDGEYWLVEQDHDRI